MLISHVPEGGGGVAENMAQERDNDGNNHEYRTASELFDLMARNHNFQPNENDNLSTRDLVLLYKNIDLGTKLMSNANEFNRKSPNQYVETVVYEELDSDSDLSEIYSSEDIHNVFLVNKERIELLNHSSSLDNTLCSKHEEFEIHTCSEFDSKFRFQDLWVKNKPIKIDFTPTTNDIEKTVLPVSLLDYICCKRFEDNQNFYMDNIIKYVKHTIDQLKRISNGDYLTDRAKEKWRASDGSNAVESRKINETKVSNTMSIPLYVERKANAKQLATKWDDIVHSDVDIRSISKILEKKIVLEVPKDICTTYKLFSKCCNDNLIISCKREKHCPMPEEAEKSRLDVVLQLNRLDSGHVTSNISSIMILQKNTDYKNEILPLPPNEAQCVEEIHSKPVDAKIKQKEIFVNASGSNKAVVKINCDTDNTNIENSSTADVDSGLALRPKFYKDFLSSTTQSDVNSTDFELGITENYNFDSMDCAESGYLLQQDCTADTLTCNKIDNPILFDDLRLTMQRLNMQASLQEEDFDDYPSTITSNKKKSPTRVRIKSPYENKSLLLEEKKRKKLLEIKQRREKKKLALTEKINKNKFQKGIVSPHNASSITKLSITNKSFYNSIYGNPGTFENGLSKSKGRKDKNDCIPECHFENEDLMDDFSNPETTEKDKKIVDKSYYLDDAFTEVMNAEMKDDHKNKNDQEQLSEQSSFAMSSDINEKLRLLTALITPNDIKTSSGEPSFEADNVQEFDNLDTRRKEIINRNISEHSSIDTKDKIIKHLEEIDSKKGSASAEFRKSIDKIYQLIHKIGRNEGGTETKLCKSKFTAVTASHPGGGESSTIQCTDSGTSVKHHLTSSNPSCYSFEKPAAASELANANNNKVTGKPPANVVPKVIISSKSQTHQAESSEISGTNKKERKKHNTPDVQQSENPLKAISQLLHEFDNVQKIRNKGASQSLAKDKKVEENVAETKCGNRKITRQSSKLSNTTKENESTHRTNAQRERKARKPHVTEPSRLPCQSSCTETKPMNNNIKKKVIDIVDEIKEARGEAVRGPSKPNARLNSLAQPKRTYVQAQFEEFQAKYGKSLVTDRLQRLSGAPPIQSVEKNLNKLKKRNDGSPTYSKHSLSPSPILERTSKKTSNRSTSPTQIKETIKQSNVMNAPLKKKMVAVESYVKNHYGHSSSISDINEIQNGLKSRVPFFPHDLDIFSVSSSSPTEESSKIGSKIHHIIDTMLPLTVVNECSESREPSESSPSREGSVEASAFHKNNDNATVLTKCLQNPVTKIQDKSAGDSEKIENARPINRHKKNDNENSKDASVIISRNSVTELKFQNLVQEKLSVASIQKCLKVQNFPLDPNESLQRILLLQSGDAQTVLLKSSISQTIKNSNVEKSLSIIPELTDWHFTPFPLKISTVGYMFPQTQNNLCDPSNAINVDHNTTTQNGNNFTSDKTSDKVSQCFKGGQQDFENIPQINLKTVSSILKISSTVVIERERKENTYIDTVESERLDTSAYQPLNLSIKNRDTEVIKEPLIANEIRVENEAIIEPLNANEIRVENETIIEPLNANEIRVENEITNKNRVENVENPEVVNIRTQDDSPEYDTCIKEVPKVQYTTSLDILVGLLNEIQKITTCQTKITNNESDQDSAEQNLQMETILKGEAALENVQMEARNIISISSLDKLRQLDSSASIYSYYVSNGGEKDLNENKLNIKPTCADKEVNAIIPDREYVNRCTDVPSRFLPITVNHGINVSDSLIGIFSEPSSQCMCSYSEIPVHHNVSLTSIKKIIELPKTETEVDATKTTICNESQVKPKRVFEIITDHMDRMEKMCNIPNKALTTRIDYGSKTDIEPLLNLKDSEFDPMIKVKRDILVTMYSVLVLTVFAALSFPEILYRI